MATKPSSSSYTNVIYVKKRHAKEVKVALEREDLIDKNYRMTAAAAASSSVVARSNEDDATVAVVTSLVGPSISSSYSSTQATTIATTTRKLSLDGGSGEAGSSPPPPLPATGKVSLNDCIAIPILPNNDTEDNDDDASVSSSSWRGKVVGRGMQNCPYSTSILGNTKRGMLKSITSTSSVNEHEPIGGWNAVQRVLIHTILQFTSSLSSSTSDYPTKFNDTNNSTNDESTNGVGECNRSSIESSVASLSKRTCPKKLEFIGDDRTLVIPQTTLQYYMTHEYEQQHHQDDNEESFSFRSLLDRFILPPSTPNGDTEGEEKVERDDDDNNGSKPIVLFMALLWFNLAQTHGSLRVVRRGDIDPESKVRASGHTILWTSNDKKARHHHQKSQLTLDGDATTTIESGPGNIGWITITEHGILQSFDLTKIMFSRGNVNEKLRFGRTLVQNDEIVLDMYAGIGYYTLPALLLGKAKHVYACEWNPYAIAALRYNLMQNGIVSGVVVAGAADSKSDRVTVLEGDSRITLSSSSLVYHDIIRGGGVDRISLGLLPSSEGGWKAALSVLNKERGGWLHIHGNVPTSERDAWAFWICTKIDEILSKEKSSSITPTPIMPYMIVCSYIQRVKSFAPKIDHLVADFFVGPQSSPSLDNMDRKGYRMAIVTRDGEVVECPDHINPPSCALGGGVLDQEWMMDGDAVVAR